MAAPPARGAPRTPCGLVLLLRGLLLLRHLGDHLLPSADFGKRDSERKRRAFSTRYTHCPSTRLSVKSLSGTTKMREPFAKQLAMRCIVQPPRRAARVRHRDIGDAVFHTRSPNGGFERDPSPETIDGEAAHEKDHLRAEQRELLIEPRPAERDLGRRGPAIPAATRRLSREALRDRRPVWQVILVDAGLAEPPPKLGP